MTDGRELGLETLLAVRAELDIDLENKLLEACFDIQNKYQFDHDRALSIKVMDRLIEDYIEKLAIQINQG